MIHMDNQDILYIPILAASIQKKVPLISKGLAGQSNACMIRINSNLFQQVLPPSAHPWIVRIIATFRIVALFSVKHA